MVFISVGGRWQVDRRSDPPVQAHLQARYLSDGEYKNDRPRDDDDGRAA